MARTSGGLTPRPADPADYEPLADLFTRLWGLAHDHCTPDALRELRTRPDFLRRLHGFGDGLRVIGQVGAPLGFYAIRDNHVDQLYLDQTLWGTGAARALLDHAVGAIGAAGHATALLECNPGNIRAAAFYAKSGWTLRGTETIMLDSATGPFAFDCLIFERRLDE